VLAIGGRLEALDHGRDAIEIGKVERLVGADRKPDSIAPSAEFDRPDRRWPRGSPPRQKRQ